MAPYKYPQVPLPAQADGQWTRVLDIRPGRFDTKLHLDLRLADVASRSTRYEALSYTWGASLNGRSVTVNDEYELPVTDNLFDALRRLRRRYRHRTIWIDAICINQLDLQERAAQVTMMGDIYASATCVNVWLGEPRRCPSMTWTSCRHALSVLVYPSIYVNWNQRVRMAFKFAQNEHGTLADSMQSSSPSWHERVWVIQEFIKASRVRFLSGSHTWTTPQLHPHWTFDRDELFAPELSGLRNRVAFLELERKMRARRRSDLASMARLLRGAKATDERDLIHSILGLVDHPEASIIKADYTRPYSKVCALATYASLRTSGNHDILRGVVPPDIERQPGLPSWAVDFSNDESLAKLQTMSSLGTAYVGRFQTSRQDLVGSVELSDTLDRLTIPAARICSVDMVHVFDVHSDLPGVFWWMSEAVPKCLAAGPTAGSKAMLEVALRVSSASLSLPSLCIKTASTCRGCISEFDARVSPWLTEDERSWDDRAVDEVCSYWDTLSDALSSSAQSNVANITISYIDRLERGSETIQIPDTALLVLDSGLIGFASCSVEEGDFIVAIASDSFRTSPFLVLRRTASGLYTYRGLAYVHGCMHGEFWDTFSEHLTVVERFEII